MRIIQLSDLHVGLENEYPFAVDVRGNFLNVLTDIANERYDLLCITGDICLGQPDSEIYKWVKTELKKRLDITNIAFIAGNHDNSVLLANSFGIVDLLHDSELYYTKTIQGSTFIFLDSAQGYISESQYKWLRSQINASNNDSVNIFMHHPPCISGVRYMDANHRFNGIESFQELLSHYNDKHFNMFCGHYHTEKIIQIGNMSIYITPSCYVQIDSNSHSFVPDHYRVGYRIIDVGNYQLTTSVKYLH